MYNNKLNSHFMCKKLNIPTPKLYYYGKYNSMDKNILNKNNFVIKPIEGSRSRNVLPLVKYNDYYINKFNDKKFIINDFDKIYNNKEVIVEEFVKDDKGMNTIPSDYKFFCFKGKPEFLYICIFDEKTKRKLYCYYNMNWEEINVNIYSILTKVSGIEKPKNFEKMKEYCKKIASNVFPEVFVRLDFYLNNNNPVFGEVTPEPFGGKGYSDEGKKLLNQLCKKHNLKVENY